MKHSVKHILIYAFYDIYFNYSAILLSVISEPFDIQNITSSFYKQRN